MKALIIILILFSAAANAGQISITTVGSQQPNNWSYTSTDYRVQYSFGDELYGFIGYEQLKVCPWYCGITYTLWGAGAGKRTHFEKFNLYIQGGVYDVSNNAEPDVWNENLYYYMQNRFNGGDRLPADTIFRVDTKPALGIDIGIEIPLSDHFGAKAGYRHLQFWNNYVMHFANGDYWHDPHHAQFSAYEFGVYYKF